MNDRTVIEEREQHRRAVLVRAAIMVPGAAIALTLFLIALMSFLGGNTGAIVATIILGLISVATVFEAQAAARDLRAKPVTTRGRVNRTWSKAKILIFGRTHYVLIDRQVFEIGAVAALELQPGDPVLLEHWPHTHALISLRRDEQSRATSEAEPSDTGSSG